ncbi:hypothetical protein U6A24_02395 [Aquimarina gracilis]|uniref:Uncharacterized protein n=1 Tax=Aquimarina gracilis TaxID=874422 RepID=A0ABU5ZQF4_9FLAO|nr:hypothetical protein [Aquimarina gracilis]MEB3344289.1 hypothetical protein [Aquimarina gracilis]
MKNINTNTILQIVALLFLVIIGYMSFSSGSNWKVVQQQINETKEKLNESEETLKNTQAELKKSKEEFEKMKIRKDILIHERDSLILDFRRKNAKDWDELQRIKDSIRLNKKQLIEDRLIAGKALGVNK